MCVCVLAPPLISRSLSLRLKLYLALEHPANVIRFVGQNFRHSFSYKLRSCELPGKMQTAAKLKTYSSIYMGDVLPAKILFQLVSKTNNNISWVGPLSNIVGHEGSYESTTKHVKLRW